MNNIWRIGERIKEARTEASLTQVELGNRIGDKDGQGEIIGIKRQTVSKWEAGETYPDLKHLEKLCEVFECDLAYLLGEIDTKRRVAADVAEVTGLSEKATSILQSLMPPHRADFVAILNEIICCEGGTAFQRLSQLAITLRTLTAPPYSFEEYSSPNQEDIQKTAYASMLWHGGGVANAYQSIRPEEVVEYQIQQAISRLIGCIRSDDIYSEEV